MGLNIKLIFLSWTVACFLSLSAGCVATNQQPDTRPITPHYSFIESGGLTSGPLAIRNIELKFQNGLGDITLAPDYPPQPEAIIAFNGNGLFQAYWQIDGRNIEQVSLNVVFGQTLKLRLLNLSQIPTFEPGLHTVGLKILSPQTNLTLPIISYFQQIR